MPAAIACASAPSEPPMEPPELDAIWSRARAYWPGDFAELSREETEELGVREGQEELENGEDKEDGPATGPTEEIVGADVGDVPPAEGARAGLPVPPV